MIKALIFDLGKVVFDLSFDRCFQYWADTSGRPFESIKKAFHFDALFDDFERNSISEKEFRLEVSKRLKMNLSDEEFDAGWCDLYLEVYPSINSLLNALKKKYKLVALTNTNCIHERVWKIKYANTLTLFEKLFCSHEIRARKPEPESYQQVLDYLDLEANQTLFIDDNPINTKAASELGMTTITVISEKQMLEELDAILRN